MKPDFKYNKMKITTQPNVSVGIVSGREIKFCLNATYVAEGMPSAGKQTVSFSENGVVWNGKTYRQLEFLPQSDEASFSLYDVTIGVNFHWERKETQTFLGKLKFIVNENSVCAVNELPVERYLESVISSGELIRWYDREDHTLFDVCADDHCQRYQGITKETSAHVAEAIRQTAGQVLTDEDEICDARFSKCCGGETEEFQYCWENLRKPYLVALRDAPQQEALDLTVEANADRWIRSSPESFCNTRDAKVLSQVLNNYDQETSDFYRWCVEYTQEQVQQLLTEKLGIDFGAVVDLIPVERGTSGRLSKLRIVGEKLTLVIGKELEIRRALSKSHLYSSAFVVDAFDRNEQGIPKRFALIGAGWGHGVGLCQIGAAVMGERGYSYKEILLHYYPGAIIKQIYRQS